MLMCYPRQQQVKGIAFWIGGLTVYQNGSLFRTHFNQQLFKIRPYLHGSFWHLPPGLQTSDTGQKRTQQKGQWIQSFAGAFQNKAFKIIIHFLSSSSLSVGFGSACQVQNPGKRVWN